MNGRRWLFSYVRIVQYTNYRVSNTPSIHNIKFALTHATEVDLGHLGQKQYRCETVRAFKRVCARFLPVESWWRGWLVYSMCYSIRVGWISRWVVVLFGIRCMMDRNRWGVLGEDCDCDCDCDEGHYHSMSTCAQYCFECYLLAAQKLIGVNMFGKWFTLILDIAQLLWCGHHEPQPGFDKYRNLRIHVVINR